MKKKFRLVLDLTVTIKEGVKVKNRERKQHLEVLQAEFLKDNQTLLDLYKIWLLGDLQSDEHIEGIEKAIRVYAYGLRKQKNAPFGRVRHCCLRLNFAETRLPHVHALYEEFNLSLNWLLFDIEPMFEKRDNSEEETPREIFEFTSDDIPIYTFFSNFMRDPDIEEFFLVLLNIILRGSLDGLKKALQEDPATAAFFQDSAPGTQADADQQ